MGTLKLSFNNGDSYIFHCDRDAESIKIQKEGFHDKKTMEEEFDCYRWVEEEYLTKEKLSTLGEIKNIKVEYYICKFGTTQSGCRFEFHNDIFFHIWALPSDNIFYGLNKESNYYLDKDSRIELKDV